MFHHGSDLIKMNLNTANLLTTAENLFSAQAYPLCIDCCQNILTQGSEIIAVTLRARHLLALSYYHLEQFGSAILELQQLMILVPDEALYLIHLGNVYRKQGLRVAAIAQYQKALECDTNHAQAFNNLANIYFDERDHHRAVHFYQKAIAQDQKYADPYLNCALAKLYLQQSEHGKIFAKEKILEIKMLLKKFIELNMNKMNRIPHQDTNQNQNLQCVARAHFLLAQLTYAEENWQETIEHCQAALNFHAHQQEARHLLAHSFMLNANYEQAIAQYSVYLEKNPTDQLAHYNLGTLLIAKQDFAAARFHFEKIVQLEPTHVAALINLAAICLSQKKIESAKNYYQEILRLDPKQETAAYMLAALAEQQSFARAPTTYVENLFDSYANYYDQHMAHNLSYQTPQLILDEFIKLVKIDSMAISSNSIDFRVSGNTRSLVHSYPIHHRGASGVSNNVEYSCCLSILDLGCGTGLMGEKLKPFAKLLTGVDLSGKMIAKAKQRACYDELCTSDLQNYLEQTQQQFDIIIAADVFIYFGDLTPLLLSAKKRLKPDGFFIFTVEASYKNADFHLCATGRYVHRLNYLQTVVSAAGFNVLTSKQVVLRMQDGEPVAGYLLVLMFAKSI